MGGGVACSIVFALRVRVKPAFHNADIDTDILADILARMSVSVSWNAGLSCVPLYSRARSRRYLRR